MSCAPGLTRSSRTIDVKQGRVIKLEPPAPAELGFRRRGLAWPRGFVRARRSSHIHRCPSASGPVRVYSITAILTSQGPQMSTRLVCGSQPTLWFVARFPARMPFATDSVTKYIIFQEKSLPLPEGRLEGRTVIVTGSNRYVVVVFPLRLH